MFSLAVAILGTLADLPADASCFDVKEDVTGTQSFYRALKHFNPMVCGDLQAWIRLLC